MRTFPAGAAVALLLFLSAAPAVSAPEPRPYAAGHFLLSLDGELGVLKDVDGGSIRAEVAEIPQTSTYFVKKQLSGLLHANDIVLDIDAAMPPQIYQWMAESLKGAPSVRSGAIIAVDSKGNILERRDFFKAQIVEIQFPGVDASSKDEVAFRVRIRPQSTQTTRPAGNLAQPPCKRKPWQASNFRFGVDGIGMVRIDTAAPFVVTAPYHQFLPGQCILCTATVNFPDLSIEVPEANAQPLTDWFEDFVVAGNNKDQNEKGATLDYLSPTGDVLFTVSFRGLGPYSMSSNTDKHGLSTMRLRMYAEVFTFAGVGTPCP